MKRTLVFLTLLISCLCALGQPSGLTGSNPVLTNEGNTQVVVPTASLIWQDDFNVTYGNDLNFILRYDETNNQWELVTSDDGAASALDLIQIPWPGDTVVFGGKVTVTGDLATNITDGKIPYSASGVLTDTGLTWTGSSLLINGPTAIISSLLTRFGALTYTGSAAAGHGFSLQGDTETDTTTGVGMTATVAYSSTFGAPTLAASNANVTTTDSATLYISGAPVAGTNMTLTNPYALIVDAGDVRVDDNLIVGTLTDNRLVIAGTSGILEDDSSLTFDGSTLAVTGNITVTGNVDGRDVSVDGTNQDTHIADSTIHFTEGSIDHGALGGLSDAADHPQYSLIDGTRNFTGPIHIVRTDGTIVTNSSSGIIIEASASTGDGSFVQFSSGNTGTSGLLFGNTTTADRGFLTYAHANDSWSTGLAGATKLYMTAAGLSVGHSNEPTAALDVSGEGTFSDDLTLDSALPEFYLIEDDVVDNNYRLRVSAGAFEIAEVTDAKAFVANRVTIDMSGNIITSGTLNSGGDVTVPNLITSGNVDGRDVSVDGTKLDTIETNAKDDQTGAEILTLLLPVDGSTSLLDADLLDGLDSTAFAGISHAHTHASTTGQTASDHHVKTTSGDIDHDSITGVSTSDHHVKTVSSDIDHDSITGVSTSDHHVKTVSSEIDHGTTTGLGDDDHTQYILVTGARAFTGAVVMNDDLTVDGGTLFVDDSENEVGIGTITPDNELSVNGTVDITGSLGVGTTTPEFLAEIVGGASGVTTKVLGLRSNSTSTSTGTTLKLTNSTAADSPIGAEITSLRTNASSSGDSDLIFSTSAAATQVERMRLFATGNLTVGQSSPTDAADVTLLVEDAANDFQITAASTSGGSDRAGYKYRMDTTDFWDTILDGTDGDEWKLRYQGTEWITVTPAGVVTFPGSSSGLDHGDLDGLGGDGHTQYSLVTGARAFTGTVTVNNASAQSLTLTRDAAGSTLGSIIIQQPNTTDGNALRIGYQTDSTGGGAASNVDFADIKFIAKTHDNATRAGNIAFYLAKGGTGFVERMLLDEDGDLQMDGTLTVSGTGTSSFTGAVTMNDDLTVDGGTLFVDDSLNRVGIGDITPDNELTVNGTVDITADLMVGTTVDSGARVNIELDSDEVYSATAFQPSGLHILNRGDGAVDNTFAGIKLQVTQGGGQNAVGEINLIQLLDTAHTSDLAFKLRASGGTLSEVLRMTSSGNVGIGTTSPGVKLEVKGTSSGFSTDGEIISIQTATVNHRLSLGVDSTNEFAWIRSVKSGVELPLILQNGGGGFVGISTSSPTHMLEVNGTMMVELAAQFNDDLTVDGGTLFVDDSANEVGVGTITPDNELTVNGDTDITGRLFIKDTAFELQEISGAAHNPTLQVNDTGNGGISFTQWNNATAHGAYLWLSKSYNSTTGTHTIVNNGETLGAVNFSGSDGTTFNNAASIRVEIDGVPGLNDMPGRLIFSTTPDGANSPVEAMRIENSGNVLIGTTSAATNSELTVADGITVNNGGIHLVDGSMTSTVDRLENRGGTLYFDNAAVGAGGGESNTASNVTVGGVGIFKQKSGVDLEFNGVNSGSSKVSVALDAGNNQIDIDVVENQINHDSLLGFVAGEHRVINDGSTSTTELWSSSKISSELGGKQNLDTDLTTIAGLSKSNNNIMSANGSAWTSIALSTAMDDEGVVQNTSDIEFGSGSSHTATTSETAISFGTSGALEITGLDTGVTYLITGQVTVGVAATRSAGFRVRLFHNAGAVQESHSYLDDTAQDISTVFIHHRVITSGSDTVSLKILAEAGSGAGAMTVTAAGSSLIATKLF